jgi:hypothetical protein
METDQGQNRQEKKKKLDSTENGPVGLKTARSTWDHLCLLISVNRD